MTQLATIFAQPIDRHIEGVIKADDEAGLRQEVEEYVLTNEVAKRLDVFLSAYNNYQGANGVWISGFFGSGKSHLLKILAMLLENRAINETQVLDLFLPKCGDELLKADLKRAVSIPSKSILFNIDQKADVISKTQMDALLAVFVKVFDETCGYYGKQGHIAQFERDLDNRGQYDAFKEAFEQIAGIPWETGREQALLEGANIAQAYAQAAGVPAAEATGILDKYRQQYKLSIEDFAEKVNEYIARQEPNFRLNFFVDEVGQYIADNIKLMTNLQTMAESLATKCNGRAWIIVTAQEDMNTVVGEMGRQQSNDFSKIQARFKNRMKLTSADVAEVIQKRLLLKNEMGIAQLSAVYAQQENNFKTLFDFADGAQTYRNYRDRDHFIHSYPFIPYQFPLFQAAIQNLSLHNAFEGKHSSVGERSMLGVFQEVAKQIARRPLGELATFDLMFEGIRTALKSNIQRAVILAENNLENRFAIQVLKALLLVKYVKEFKATLRNLTVLMLPHFDADLPALKRRLEEALNLLEMQTYIQRNGEQYEYLTDEEKDVEQEIKATEVDNSAVSDELNKLIFDLVIRDRKIRYEDNGQDYAFTRKLDDQIFGREYELTIHVISPFHSQFDNETILRAQAMGRDELLVILPPNDRLVRDLRLYKQTDKYVQQNISLTQQDSIKRILQDKLHQNQERGATLRLMAQDLVGQAKLIAAGQDLDITSTDPKTRLVQGFHELILRSYPNLTMLRGTLFREDQIADYLKAENYLPDMADATISEAERELLAFVQMNKSNGLRTTLQSLVTRFERKPYGWYLAAIQGNLARLCARGKVELWQDSNVLEGDSIVRALRNTHGHAQINITILDIPEGDKRWLRTFYADYFDRPPAENEAKALAQATANNFREQHQTLTRLRQQAADYPFLTALDEPIQKLEGVKGQLYTYYLTELRAQEDDLLDLKEQIIDPIQRFMNGAQKEIYDEIRNFLRSNSANFSYVGGSEAQQLRAVLDDPHCYRGGKIQQAKAVLDGLKSAVSQQLQTEKANTLAKVETRWQRLRSMAEFEQLTQAQQAELEQPFTRLRQRIEEAALIDVMHGGIRQFDEATYPALLNNIAAWLTPDVPDEDPPVVRETVALRSLYVPYTTPWLNDEADIASYLQALEKVLRAEIEKGKKIQI